MRVSAASSCVRTHHSRKVWTFACKHERQSQRKTDKAHTQERKSTVRTGTRGIIMYIRRRQHPLRMNVVYQARVQELAGIVANFH